MTPARGKPPPWRSLRYRIVATFLTALLALLGAQGFLVWQQRQVSASFALITATYIPLSKVVAQLERDRQRVEDDLETLVREGPRLPVGAAPAMVVYTEQIRRELEEGRIYARSALHGDLPPEERAVLNRALTHLDRVESAFRDYQARSTEVARHLEAGLDEEAREGGQLMIVDGRRLGQEIDSLSRLLDARVEQLTDASQRAQVRANAVAGTLSLLATALAVVLVLAVLLALRPVGRLTAEVQRLAAGDYGGRVEVRGSDEIALLAGEFNAMVRALELRDRTLVERAEELNRLSRYLGSVLDALEEGLVVVEEGRVTLANPAAERVWAAATGQAPPETLAAVPVPGRAEVDGPGATLHEVRTARFGDSGAVVVASDITEASRTREALARSERLALIGQMLAQITHEVRNPLNALSLNAELLGDELEELDAGREAEAWEILGTISAEIERLTALTHHYLQLARRPPAHLEPEDLGHLVRDVIRLLDVELESQEVGLSLELDEVGPQQVDGKQLRQALLNVVRNAVEAGGRALVLSLRVEDGRVLLELQDDGPGMTEAEIERACDPFFSTKASGTGLGLAITKQILEDHHGALDITSGPRGTRVGLVLPVRPPAAPEG